MYGMVFFTRFKRIFYTSDVDSPYVLIESKILSDAEHLLYALFIRLLLSEK